MNWTTRGLDPFLDRWYVEELFFCGSSTDDEFGSRYNIEVFTTGVIDLSEVDLDFTVITIRISVTLMDQMSQFLESQLLCSVTKHKQHGINHVRLATSIGTHNRREGLDKNTFQSPNQQHCSSLPCEMDQAVVSQSYDLKFMLVMYVMTSRLPVSSPEKSGGGGGGGM